MQKLTLLAAVYNIRIELEGLRPFEKDVILELVRILEDLRPSPSTHPEAARLKEVWDEVYGD